MKRIVVLGGGFGGVAAARRLSKIPDAEVLLVNRTNFLTYTPFLADLAGGTMAIVHAIPPLRMMAPDAKVEVAEIIGIDVAAQKVHVCLDGRTCQERGFDYLVVALGAHTNYRHGAGSERFGFPLYAADHAFVLRNHVLEMLELAEASVDPDLRREALTFVFCGGGFSGVEGAAAIQDLVHGALKYYKTIKPDEPTFILAPHGHRLLEQIDEKLGDYVVSRLRKRGVDVRLGVGATEVAAHSVTLTTGEVVPTRTVLWAAGIEVSPVLREVGLPKDRHGAIQVDHRLQVHGHENVYALGDCAAVPTADGGGFYAPTAQNALREGPVAADNIRALIEGREPHYDFEYDPIGALASLGHRQAVAQVMGVKLSGFLAWFMWRGIYLTKLPNFTRKFQVGMDWIGDVFAPVETTYFPLAPIMLRFARSDEVAQVALRAERDSTLGPPSWEAPGPSAPPPDP